MRVIILSMQGFHFLHVPQNHDHTGVKVFINTESIFSLEYLITEPSTINIHMIPVQRKSWRKKSLKKNLAIIQQFASSLGLHPDSHLIDFSPTNPILELLQSEFQFESEGTKYYCGGVIGKKNKEPFAIRPFTTNFIDDLLEILTDSPHFAVIQLVFKSVPLPKGVKLDEEVEHKRSHVKFNLREGKVERNYSGISRQNIVNESGCFEFSPRILLIETDVDILATKLERISVIFSSSGFKSQIHPTFFRRFSFFRKIMQKRKLISSSLIDGYSLMNYIALPKNQYSHEGYKIVPNKSYYSLTTSPLSHIKQERINLGVPILSGKTSDIPLTIGGKELSRHMAVFGMTGEGKSRFIYSLIKEYSRYGRKFIIIDPKGEYLPPVQNICSDFIYLKPGSSNFPWGINIFQIPKDSQDKNIIPQEDHIQFVVSVLENVLDEHDNITPQMRRLLHLGVESTILKQGNLGIFLDFFKNIPNSEIKGPYIENSAIAMLNRFQKFRFGNVGRCFSVKQTSFEIVSLLENNVIIDLSTFEMMEDELGRRLFLEVLLQNLYYHLRTSRPPIKEESLPKNILIMDEIQKLLPSKSKWNNFPTSMISKGPWTLRAYDISMIFVGTDPIVDQPMLSNTGIKAVFFTTFDPNVIANMLGIPRNEYEQLRKLLKIKNDEHRCLLAINGNISLIKTNNFPLDPISNDLYLNLELKSTQLKIKQSYENLIINNQDLIQ